MDPPDRPKMQSSRKRRQPKAKGHQDALDCSEPDPATRRRLRNRLSQRQFRERRLLYIKELEERSKLSTQTESDRNKALAQETADLKKEMLRIRSQVLKLSVSLNAIGSEVGKFLDKDGHVVSDEGREVTGRPSPTDSNSEQATPPPPTVVDMQRVEAPEEETYVDPDGNGGSRGYGGADAGDSVSLLAASEWPAEASTLLQEDDAAADSNEPNMQGDDGAGRCMDTQDCGALVPEQHDCLDFLPGPLEADLGHDELTSILLDLVPGNRQHVLPPDLRLPGDTPFANWDPAPNADLEEWMMSMFPPPQDAWPNALQEESTDGSRQQARGESGLQREPSLSIPALPSPGGLKLPPGLFPAPRKKTSHAHIQMQSRLSEHMETLEQYVRCKLDAAPEKISRQVLYQWCRGILTLMTEHAWPSTYPVWFKSQVPEILAPIIAWRLCPTAEAHRFLAPCHRPTELQLTIPHSPIIDWVVYAPLRDRILLCYNGNVALDRLICEYLNSHVIEVEDVSQIIPNAPPEKGYFGVWNVYKGIYTSSEGGPDYSNLPVDINPFEVSLEAGDFSMQQGLGSVTCGSQLPRSAPFTCSPASSLAYARGRRQSPASDTSGPLNVVKILTTPELALRLSHDVRLYAAKSWRVDRSFFRAWPELKFDGYEKIIAQGRSYRIYTEPPEAPTQMTEATAKLYHDALEGIAQVVM